MSAEMVRARLNDEFELVLPAHRAARPEWSSERGWEKERLHSMHDRLGAGDVVFYCGAELGEMTALCSLWGADVVCFEPNYKSWPVIKAVYDANGLKPPLANFCGFVSDTTRLEPPKPDAAIYGGRQWELRPDGWPVCVEGEIVEAHGFNQLFEEADGLPQTTIDDFVARTGIIPTVITMDTEGSEGRILRGAEQTIKAHRPKLWISLHPEFLIQSYGEYSRDLRNWIIDLGYDETLLAWEHEGHFLYLPKEVV